jgi:hypothetical protein
VEGGAGIVDEVIEALVTPAFELAPNLGDEAVEGGGVAGVELEGGGPPPESIEFGNSGVRLCPIGPIGDDEINTVLRQGPCRVATKPAAAAGDDRGLSL